MIYQLIANEQACLSLYDVPTAVLPREVGFGKKNEMAPSTTGYKGPIGFHAKTGFFKRNRSWSTVEGKLRLLIPCRLVYSLLL